MTQVIYKIINLLNGKFYVGSTTNQKVRFRQHRKLLRGNRHHCKHLQAAWNMYGEEKFTFVIVEHISTEQSLWAAEDVWLKEHVGKEHCYNVGTSADAPMRGRMGAAHPGFGKLMHQDQKEAISTTLKAFYAEDYANHPRVGTAHTEETKAKISAAKLENPQRHWLGKTRDEATREKISAAQRGVAKAPGRRVSEAGLAKIRAAVAAGHYANFAGETHTAEAKAKMSRRVRAIDASGNSTVFDSVTELREVLALKPPTVNRALKSGKPIKKGPQAGWRFEYVDIPGAT